MYLQKGNLSSQQIWSKLLSQLSRQKEEIKYKLNKRALAICTLENKCRQRSVFVTIKLSLEDFRVSWISFDLKVKAFTLCNATTPFCFSESLS